VASIGVGLVNASSSLPIYAVMAASGLIGLAVLLAKQSRAHDASGAPAAL
jgi:hypothetical protein